MKHRNIEFDVEEAEPHKWRWKIYPKAEAGPKIIGGQLFDTRTEAMEACIAEINEGLDERDT
jgi:hypothetical protein